jgi:integrase/recombinase XerD
VTALKNYFRWLAGDNIIPSSPAEALVFERVIPPLPDILDRKEAERFAEAALKTPFEHVVVMLILGAGLKRSELLALKKEHINISDPLRPTVKVKGKKHYTERILVLPLDFVQSYNAFVEQYKPESPVFKCTERSLNYVLSCIANRAGINKHVSCQILRDSFAVQCLRAGEKMDAVLKKLGLARTTANEETRHKYQRLLELYG